LGADTINILYIFSDENKKKKILAPQEKNFLEEKTNPIFVVKMSEHMGY